MSWAQWRGEIWPTTMDEVGLSVLLWPPETGGQRQSWNLRLDHSIHERDAPSGPFRHYRALTIEISDLHFREKDWRRFSGWEVRSDPAWQDAHESITDYGRMARAEINVNIHEIRRKPDGEAETLEFSSWTSEDFILRFGTRDGIRFACELDAWLISDKEYRRTLPETLEEAARFAEGPPNLRMLAPAAFAEASVMMPRGGDDPIPTARRYLLEETGCDHLHPREVRWASRRSLDRQGHTPVPGWTSTVDFTNQESP